MTYLALDKPPADFAPSGEAAGCYCEWDGKLLFVRRHPEKAFGNTWGIPGGKLEPTEDAQAAVMREVEEEVGIRLEAKRMVALGSIYMRLPQMDYTFHMFYQQLLEEPQLVLAEQEHLEARWVTPEQALQLPLIVGGVEALRYFLRLSLSRLSGPEPK
jgi:mutator protein MutT